MRNWSARNRRVGLAVTPPAIPTEARPRPTTPLTRPKRRPPRPGRPIFSIVRRGGLHFGHNIGAGCSFDTSNRGIALHEGPTRRRHAARGLRVVRNPHQCRDIEQGSPASRETHTPQRPAQKNSHIIYDGHYSSTPKNVAIPTIYFRGLKHHQWNYVRNCLNP